MAEECATNIHHLMSKTLYSFELQIWLEIITSRDAKSWAGLLPELRAYHW